MPFGGANPFMMVLREMKVRAYSCRDVLGTGKREARRKPKKFWSTDHMLQRQAREVGQERTAQCSRLRVHFQPIKDLHSIFDQCSLAIKSLV